MLIGLDFDNTIASYAGVFHAAAVRQGLIPHDVAPDKRSVRDYLRGIGREDDWTELQGYVYGCCMELVAVYDGFQEFLTRAYQDGHELAIVSHKTRTPYRGPAYDLHAAARAFLEARGIVDGERLTESRVFFETTIEDKLNRVRELGCDIYVDDLPEVLGHAVFPDAARRILFDPDAAHLKEAQDDPRFERTESWRELSAALVSAESRVPPARTLDELAGRLSARAGTGEVAAVTPLSGGRNNRLARVDTPAGAYVLKSFNASVQDPRDRMGAEESFLDFAAARGVPGVTPPVARDWLGRAMLYPFVDGRRPEPGEVDETLLDRAVDFLAALNAPPRTPDGLPIASEAAFSLQDHLDAIDARVARLDRLDPDAPYVEQARRFVADRLQPAWRDVRAHIEAAARSDGPALDRRLTRAQVCVSPSDFGFHNTLLTDDGLAVFDFEYAGVDDPAKLVCDMFCQPQVPVPARFFEPTIARLAELFDADAAFAPRCRLLLDAYRIKWICIMLNEFVATDAARRAFAQGDDRRAERCAEQLDKVDAALGSIALSGADAGRQAG
jgi:hypothetical protein